MSHSGEKKAEMVFGGGSAKNPSIYFEPCLFLTIIQAVSKKILQSKLLVPSTQSFSLSRPNLIKWLRQNLWFPNGFQRKLTLLSAPAGFGKTSCVASWLQSEKQETTFEPPLTFAWVSLDKNDNTPTSFFIYLISALQTAVPHLGEAILAGLFANESPAPHEIVTVLLNEMTDIETPFVLVLDDYHFIESTLIHEAVTQLIEYLPSTLHLVIITRADPLLPLARWRARRILREVRANTLRFSDKEATQFLQEVMQLPLSNEEVDLLVRRTEGWIAGLQLAALALQNEPNKTEFIHSFAGDDRYIVDYLVGEVLAQQPPDLRQFLLKTAVLLRFNASLCNAVTEQTNSQRYLEKLEQQNLFIVPLDTRRNWFRYHHLFAYLLRSQLRLAYAPAEIALFQQRAIAQLEAEGLIDEAVYQAIAMPDYDIAVRLIEAHVNELLWADSAMSTLWHWLEALPNQIINQRPFLLISRAWLRFLLLAGEWTAIEADILLATTAFKTEPKSLPPNMPPSELWIQIDMLHANQARFRGESAQTIHYMQKALKQVSPENGFFLSGGILGLATAYEMAGDLVQAVTMFKEGITLAKQSNNIYAVLLVASRLIDLLLIQGQLLEAHTMFVHTYEATPGQSGPNVGFLHIAIGNVYREQNRLELAEMHLQKGIKLCRAFLGWQVIVQMGLIRLARVKWGQQAFLQSLELLQEANGIDLRTQMPYMEARPQAVLARYWILNGQLPGALSWAETAVLRLDNEIPHLHLLDYLSWARLLIAQAQPETHVQVLTLLTRLAEWATEAQATMYLIEIEILRALAYAGNKEIETAVKRLTQALSLAYSQGYVRLFLDEGPLLQELLQNMSASLLSPPLRLYRQQLLDSFPTVTSPITALIDPLSEKELQTLKLLATDLSTPEIADHLVVAVSTIRSHTKSIYSKLNAHSRHEAVQIARSYGLV